MLWLIILLFYLWLSLYFDILLWLRRLTECLSCCRTSSLQSTNSLQTTTATLQTTTQPTKQILIFCTIYWTLLWPQNELTTLEDFITVQEVHQKFIVVTATSLPFMPSGMFWFSTSCFVDTVICYVSFNNSFITTF